MKTTHLLYLHGFLSSPASNKARITAAAIANRHPSVTWLCPMLAASPKQAMADVLQSISQWPKPNMAVVGSSLGGFYATWLAEQIGCRAVLLNPAVRPARDLRPHLGEHALWHDSSQHFVLEPEFIDELQAMELDHISQPERYFAVIAKGDEVLDWKEMTGHYPGASVKLLPQGDHALSDYEQHLDEIIEFLNLV
jgi:predicted esterase YcpF (UPF0227 family)